MTADGEKRINHVDDSKAYKHWIRWEGTAVETGKTGWFPSNYVVDYKAPVPPTIETIRAPEEIQAFRSVVYNDLLESERAHCAELRGLLENFLEPLEISQM
jgi:Rho guanine nucleotide exchange factor 7